MRFPFEVLQEVQIIVFSQMYSSTKIYCSQYKCLYFIVKHNYFTKQFFP